MLCRQNKDKLFLATAIITYYSYQMAAMSMTGYACATKDKVICILSCRSRSGLPDRLKYGWLLNMAFSNSTAKTICCDRTYLWRW
ncbi:MAG: hypothetical protein RMZ41_023745 [Nostoc sp. DedVER02]